MESQKLVLFGPKNTVTVIESHRVLLQPIYDGSVLRRVPPGYDHGQRYLAYRQKGARWNRSKDGAVNNEDSNISALFRETNLEVFLR